MDPIEKPLLRSRAILLVEDDPDTARLMCQLVRALGYEVTVAATGRKALEQLSTHDYSAIMLDLILPDLDGFAVLEYLQQRKSSALRRLIVTTGMPEKYVGHIDQNQICAVMQKPIDAAELSRMLDRCVQEAS
jgi:two-component system OmpR family response regulator